MPVLNEERHLADSVAQVLDQDWQGDLEVVLALGPSKDRTGDVAAELAAADRRVITVANPSGRTPDALNAAIAASSGQIIARVDAHAEIPRDYLSTAVAALEATGADNVGGIMHAVGVTDLERAIACAMRSRACCSCRPSSRRTGTAISAAAVGVGARRSAAKSISVVSVS